MAQRPTPSSGLAIGAAAAGGLMILGSSSQAFVSAPAVAASGHNLRASSALAAQSQPAASAAGASVAPVVACTGFAAAALAGQRASRRQNRSSALPTVVPVQSAVQRRALDQSSRYADLSLDEEQLIKNGKHLLVAYIMKPKAGYDYLATAAHFAAESSTGTNVNVCTTDDFTKSVDALVYYIDPDNEEMKIAYPTLLFADDPNEMIARGKYVLSQYYIDPDNEEMKIAYPTLLFADDPNEMIARGKYVLSQFGYYIDPDNEEMKIAYPTLLFADDPNEMIARGGSFGHKDGPKPGAISYYIDPDNEEMKIAYPTLLFDRNSTDGRAMMCSVLTLSIGNNQGMGDVEYGKIYDIYFPPAYLRLFDGPNCNVVDMWRILNRGMSNGGLIVGTIIKPKLGLQPKPFGEACYAFWQGGDFIKNDEPQGNQVFCQMNECIPEVVKAMRAAIKETGSSKLFSANITADDPNEMIARGKYVLSQFGPLGENCAFLVDGYVAGGTAITVARRNFPSQFLHYHRAGHGAITSPQTQRGYTAFVHTKIARVIGASGIHTGTMSFGKMEGDASDKNIAFMLQDDEADGPYYHQEWEGMKQTTPIISGGMNALRLPAFFENLGHSNVILTAGGGSFGHKDGPKPGAISCCQGEESWKEWKAGKFGDVSLSDGIIEFAKTHEELKGAFLTFQKDADQIYPGWKEKLGYTGESSVQAATFDWAKKAAAAALVGSSSSQ
ncbi:unnamed protein product, partial [Polarella glacialis]